MVEDPFLPFTEEVTEIGNELEEVYAEGDDVKASGNLKESCFPSIPKWVVDDIVSRLETACRFARLLKCRAMVEEGQPLHDIAWPTSKDAIVFPDAFQASLFSKIEQPLLSGGRRVNVVLSVLSFVYSYLTGFSYSPEADSFGSKLDSLGSKADSSGSLEFRDIYISIVLFRAAYVWIKFRDVIPRRAVYRRPGSNKFEPRIKFPVTSGVGGKSKRIPLGLYDTVVEAEVAYQIAAFYCNKPKHRLGRLDLGGGASFPIPVLSLDPNLPYEEKVKQVGDQVLRVYAEFEVQKASKNLLPHVPGLALEMPNGEGQLSTASSPIQHLRQPLNSGIMDSSMQCQGSHLDPNMKKISNPYVVYPKNPKNF